MLRTCMRGLVALMLVATLLLPAVTVGAQDEEIDASQAPVTTQETIPEAAPPPVEDEPPMVEPQPEAPVMDDPVVEEPIFEPVVEEPVIDEPLVQEPVTEEPVAQEPVTEDPVLEPDNPDTEMPAEPVDGEGTEATDEEEAADAAEETEAEETLPDDSVDDAAAVTVISGASLDCDGTLTFTITEAADETLNVSFRNLHAPTFNQDMGSVSFPVTETGTFQVSVAVADFVDVFQADISSPLAGGVIGQAAAYGCISGEEQTLGGISDMTLSCAGVTTFTIGAIDGAVSISLYDGSTNPHTLIASQGLGFIIDGGGESRTIDFGIPADTYDSLVVRAYAHNNWGPLDIAYADSCVDDDLPTAPQIQNLSVSCDGLVMFELISDETVTLDVQIFVPAAAPGFRDETQFTANAGAQSIQFTIPTGQFNEYGASVSHNDTYLGDALVGGCWERLPNTPTGNDVAVPVAGGSITFENVIEAGETYLMRLDAEFAPPLPAEYQDQLVFMIDLSTTAVISGSAEVCLPVVEVAAEDVRLLHFENGAWVDITTFAGDGQVCGVTSSFSPFAVVRTLGEGPVDPGTPGEPGQPGGPANPGWHGTPDGYAPQAHAAGTSSSTTVLPGLPNTGSGEPSGTGVANTTLPLLLSLLALGVALTLRTGARRQGDWRG